MDLSNTYFIIGTAYAGKSTMVRLLADKHGGIACGENYHEQLMDDSLDPREFPCLCYTRDLADWHDFVRRTPEEYEAWILGASAECEVLELRLLEDICAGEACLRGHEHIAGDACAHFGPLARARHARRPRGLREALF